MAMPQGKNTLAIRAANSTNLVQEASSMMANDLPEYSRTMASCTMVSSKWVAGLSKGTRAFSAMRQMKKAAAARKRLGWTRSKPVLARL